MRPTPRSASPDLPDDLLRELTDAELDALVLGVDLAEECRTLAPGEIRDPMRHLAEDASLLTDAQLDDTISPVRPGARPAAVRGPVPPTRPPDVQQGGDLMAPMPQTFDPVALRDAYIQAYRMRQPTPAAPTFNPMDAALFGQFSQGPPTTSPIGEIARGLLAAYVGRRMGRDQLAYDDEERQKRRDEEFADWDRQRAALQRDRLSLFGLESGMKFGETVADPTKFHLTPAMRGNLDVIGRELATNPEYRRATESDPSFPLRALRSVASTNEGLGLTGATPYRDPIKFGKGDTAYDLNSGQWITPPGGAVVTDLITTPTMYQTEGGEYRFGFFSERGQLVKDLRAATAKEIWFEKELGDGGVDLQIQKELSDLVDGRIGVWTQDPNDPLKTIRAVPPELQDLKLYLTGRATNILNENAGMPAAIAAKIAYDEAEVSGLIPKIQEAPPPDTRGWLDRLMGAEAPTAAPPRLGQSGIDPRYLGYEVTPFSPLPGQPRIPGGAGFRGIPFALPASGAPPAAPGGNPIAPNAANAAGPPGATPAMPAPAPPRPPAPSLMGLFGFTPKLHRDAQGWYAPQGGSKGGKRYLSPKEVAQETLNQIGQTPQQDDSGRWFVSLGGRGGRRYLSDDELERLDAALGTMTKRVNVVP